MTSSADVPVVEHSELSPAISAFAVPTCIRERQFVVVVGEPVFHLFRSDGNKLYAGGDSSGAMGYVIIGLCCNFGGDSHSVDDDDGGGCKLFKCK